MKRINLIVLVSLMLGLLMVACAGVSQGGDSASMSNESMNTPSVPPEEATILYATGTNSQTVPGLDGPLSKLYLAWQTDSDQIAAIADDNGLIVEGNRVEVMFHLEEASLAESVIQAIEVSNGKVTAHYRTWLDAWIPIADLEQVANLSGVLLVSQPGYADFDAPTVTGPTPKEVVSIPRLDPTLVDLYASWGTDPDIAASIISNHELEVEEDRVLVVVELEDVSFLEAVMEEIIERDGEITSSYGTLLGAWISIPHLEKIAGLPGIWYIREPDQARPEGL